MWTYNSKLKKKKNLLKTALNRQTSSFIEKMNLIHGDYGPEYSFGFQTSDAINLHRSEALAEDERPGPGQHSTRLKIDLYLWR